MEKKYLQSILGTYLLYQRIEENMSLGFVSSVLKLNKGTLSKIEKGELNISSQRLKVLLDFYDTSFIQSTTSLEHILTVINTLFQAYIDLNDIKQKSIINSYIDLNTSNDDYSFFHKILLNFMIATLSNAKEVQSLFEIIVRYLSIYNEKERGIIYILISKHYCDQGNYEKSLDYLSFLDSNYPDYSEIGALNFYLKSACYQHLNNGMMAYIYAEKSYNFFKNSLSFERIKYLKLYQANALLQIGMEKEAKNLLLNILNQSQEDIIFKRTILDNLSWCCLKAHDFKECINYANQALESGSTFQELKINIPYSLYKLEEYNLCISKINSNKKEVIDAYILYFLDLIEYRIKDNYIDFGKSANKFINQCKKFKHLELLYLGLEIMIEYSKFKCDKDSIIKYQNLMISLLK